MTADEMDFGSRRYSSEVFLVLPLDSGRFGIMSLYRDMIGIAETIEELRTMGQLAIPLNSKIVRGEPERTVVKGVSLEGIEL